MSAVAHQGFELRSEPAPFGPLLRELWRSRNLIRILARKDFYVRYRRASFGLLWAIGLPLVQASVLAVVLSRITRFHTPVPQAVFIYSGILPWMTFIGGLMAGTQSIVDNSPVATRIYFPRAVFPLVVVASNFYGFAPGLAVLVVLHLAFGGSLGVATVLLIPATLLLLALTSAFALLLAGLQVYFRDVRHILAALTLPWMWASGVFFDPHQLGGFGTWLKLNPVVGMIQLFRAGLGAGGVDWIPAAWIAVAWAAVLLGLAAIVHRHYDRVFVDLL